MTANRQTMLKLQHLLLLTCMTAAMLAVSSCSDDDQAENPQKDTTTIVASIEGISVHTRTSIVEDKKGVWNKNDAFGVFHIPEGKSAPAIAKFTCPDANGTAGSVTFTGKLEGGATASYAVYPHQDNMSINGTTITMELPKEFTYTEASNGPMYADASNPENELAFKHLTGLLKLKVGSNIPVTAKKFRVTADKAIAGTCKADLKAANPVLAVEAAGSSKTITINLDIKEEGLRTFYIPIPAGTYNTLSTALLDASGAELYPSKERKDLTIARAGMYSTTFDYTEIDAGTDNIDKAIMEAVPSGDQTTPVTTDIEIAGTIDVSSTPSIAIPVNANSNVNLSLATAPATANGALELKDANNSTASPAAAVNTVTVSIPKVENAEAAPNFTITMPKTTVVLAAAEAKGAVYGKVIAKTAANTLVVAKGVTINELIVEGGNVRAEGTVKAISKAEALTSPVYLIKEAGATLPENTTGFTVIDAAAYDMKTALANGENYALTADADITDAYIVIPEGKTATLDLNGYTVTASNSTDESGRITIKGNLTLKDSKGNGKIIAAQDYKAGSYDTGIIRVSGENAHMTMESGYINAIRNDAANKGQFGIGLVDGGDFTMTGGKIEAGWFALTGNGNDKTQNSEIKIEGGELISTADYAIYLPQSGKTIISGGTITGACGGIGMRRGTLEIKGDAQVICKDNGSTGDWKDGTGNTGNAVISIGNGKQNTYGDCDVTISGGTFIANGTAPVLAKRADANHTIDVDISGGTFSDPTALAYLTKEANVNIELEKDYEGAGFGLFNVGTCNGSKGTVTVDLKNHTWTLSDEPLYGSTGTVNQYMHLEEGATVTLQNGTIQTKKDAAQHRMLIQNYCNLTLRNLKLIGKNVDYVLSNNCGSAMIDNTTITAGDSNYAFDVCGFANYKAGVSVTVKGNSVINGKVEISRSNGNTQSMKLNIEGGAFNGNLEVHSSVTSEASAIINISGSPTFIGSNWSNYYPSNND